MIARRLLAYVVAACLSAIGAVAASLAAIGIAHAQDAASLKKQMPGQWELSTTERSKTCVVTLKADAAG
ncbi:peptidase, partial [Bradyrhizobium sp. NBAIM01]|nr:peptidase [Bradyrhizobium sp. NBAIM01]